MGVVPFRQEYRNLQPEDVLPSFLMFKKASGVSPRTLEDYKTILRIFFKRHPDGLDNPRAATMEFLAAYDNPSSYNIRFAYLKILWDWMSSEGLLRGDARPMRGLSKRKPRGRIVRLSEGEVARLLEQPNRDTHAGARDFAMMVLQIDSCIRPGEAVQLMPEDFSAARMEVSVRAPVAKSKKARTLPVSPPTASAIQRLLSVRPSEWADAPLFPTQYGTPFTVADYSKRVKQYGKQCGLEVTAYSLRHASALLLLRKGVSAFALQAILGHESLQMTKHYLAITTEDTRREHAAAGVVPFILGDDAPAPRKRLRNLSPS